ncbi:peptidase S8 and S53 subtilisin kexin sedolisin [Halobacteriales archaeon QS_8_69_26]|nr:MAG: peptidase S8 and S53 subtilisin kexin sedolisin [Halobacteriales archaeon QS_8_69_26]
MTDDQGVAVNRRRFLTISGSVLGGIAVGTTVTAAESDERFLVETNDVGGLDAEVIHDLSQINLAVVRGNEEDLEADSSASTFEPDTVYQLDLPSERQDEFAAPEGGVDIQDAEDALLYPAQWDKQAQDIPAAHDITEGEGTRVSIIDTGIGTFFGDDVFHPDLTVNTDLSKNFTEDSGDAGDIGFHGTHVAGTVGANGLGVTGTAPETELVSCRVFGNAGGATFGTVVAAMVYSAEIGCDAANMSLGAYPVSREGLGDFYGKVLQKSANYANKEGTLLVAAAGNDSADLQHDGDVISLPNEAANVMSVSATSTAGFDPLFGGEPDEPAETPTSYTNYGTNAVNVSAPGGDTRDDGSVFDWVLSTAPPLNILLPYVYLAGTSMAAPQVAGAAALVKSENPGYNANQVRSVLERTSIHPRDVPGDKPYHGRGHLNPDGALQTRGGGNGKGK